MNDDCTEHHVRMNTNIMYVWTCREKADSEPRLNASERRTSASSSQGCDEEDLLRPIKCTVGGGTHRGGGTRNNIHSPQRHLVLYILTMRGEYENTHCRGRWGGGRERKRLLFCLTLSKAALGGGGGEGDGWSSANQKWAHLAFLKLPPDKISVSSCMYVVNTQTQIMYCMYG